ncbi:hypothetical protein D3C73_1406620 [compost metagenome]
MIKYRLIISVQIINQITGRQVLRNLLSIRSSPHRLLNLIDKGVLHIYLNEAAVTLDFYVLLGDFAGHRGGGSKFIRCNRLFALFLIDKLIQ